MSLDLGLINIGRLVVGLLACFVRANGEQLYSEKRFRAVIYSASRKVNLPPKPLSDLRIEYFRHLVGRDTWVFSKLHTAWLRCSCKCVGYNSPTDAKTIQS